jgi:hypothetical protein
MSFRKIYKTIAAFKVGDQWIQKRKWPLSSEEALQDILDQVKRFERQVQVPQVENEL